MDKKSRPMVYGCNYFSMDNLVLSAGLDNLYLVKFASFENVG